MYYVYVIQSKNTREIYIGYTIDLKRRLKQHNDNLSFSTKNRGPWLLIYYEAYRSRKDAKLREDRLKHYGRALAQLKRRFINSFLEV